MKEQPILCNDERIRQLLLDQLPDSLEGEVAEHVAGCPACQERIEALAGPRAWWTEVESCLRANAPQFEAPPVAESNSPSDVGSEENSIFASDFAVDFLEVCSEPGTLGKIGDYEIVEFIGRGGMGVVLKGVERDLGRYVAVKVMAPHLAASGAARQRFVREARAAAAIVHPHVMPIHSVNASARLPYLVMPYVSCESLQERLDREGPQGLAEILRIGLQTASALAAAHAQGLVHRDVKPANILLEKGIDRVLLTDFGLARAVDDASLTRTGVIAGTPQFMSPEQARGDAINLQSDLFSLGSVMYAMCTGRPPFRAETSYGVLRRITDTEPRPVRDVNAAVPDWLALTIGKLHAKCPAERFSSAAEVATLLEGCLAHVQQPTATPLPAACLAGPEEANQSRVHRPASLSPMHGALAAVGAIALLLVMGLTIWNRRPANREEIKVPPNSTVMVSMRPLSEVVAEGIGKRFPPTAGPLVLGDWPTPLRDSPGAMMTVALAPDNSAVATGCGHPNQSGELVLWDAATGRERWVRRYSRGVRSVAFAKEGTCLVTGGFDSVVRIIDVADGRLLRELRGHTGGVNGIAVAPDDRHLITGSLDDSIIVWNLDDGRVVRTLQGHTDGVLSVAVSSDGRLIASSGRDHAVRLWNLESGVLLHTLRGHEDLIDNVAFSPDNTLVASAGWDATVRLWNVASGEEIRALRRSDTKMVAVAFAPDEKELAAGGFDCRIVLWDYENDQVTKDFVAHASTPYALAYSKNGEQIASCGFDGVAKLWSADGRLVQTFQRRQSLEEDARTITRAVWSPDERHIATVHGDGVARLTDTATGAAAGELRISESRITCIALGNDGEVLWTGTDRGVLHRGDLDGHVVALSDVHSGAVTGLAISPDSKLIASGGGDGSIFVRDASDRALATIHVNSPVSTLAFDSSSRWLASGHADGRLRFWQAESGEEIASDISLARPVQELAFGSGDDLLAVMGTQSVGLWGVTFDGQSVKGSLRKTLTLAEGAFTCLAFVPGTRQLLTGDTTGATRIWSVSGGSGIVIRRKHNGGVTSIAVAPQTQTVLTAGADGAAWLWESAKPANAIQPLASLYPHPDGARDVALSPDGRRMITGGYDNHVRVWNLASGAQERNFAANESASACVLFPNGERIAVGHWNKRIHVSDVATGKREASYQRLPHGPYGLAVSSDERWLAAVFREHGAMLFDLASPHPNPVVSLTPDELPFTYAAFAPDGETFVTCTGDHERMTLPGKVSLRSAKNGAVIRSFFGHTSDVKCAAFDAEGKRLATTSGDKSVRLWDVKSAGLLATLPHAVGTFSAIFVPDSELLFTSDYHGTLLLWDLTTNEVVQQLACHADLLGRVALSRDLTVAATSSRDGTVKLWKLSGKANELRVLDAKGASAETGSR